MPRLYNKQTNGFLGSIDDDDVQCLVDVLEEEDSKDVDYFIDDSTVDIIEENGGSATLVKLLRSAVGTSEGVEIRWEA